MADIPRFKGNSPCKTVGSDDADNYRRCVGSVRQIKSWLGQLMMGPTAPTLSASGILVYLYASPLLDVALLRATVAADQATQYTLRPLGCLYCDKVWLLAEWCENRNDFHSFRLNRMQEVRVVEGVVGQFKDEPGKNAGGLSASCGTAGCAAQVVRRPLTLTLK